MEIKTFIGETTNYEKKVALEERRPKSWCKTVSAFANTDGGVILFGVSNEDEIIGLENAEAVAEKVSELVKTHLDPVPEFNLRFETVKGKKLLVLTVFKSQDTPCYFYLDGMREAFVRVGNESVSATATELKRLVLRGRGTSFDALLTGYDFADFTFTKLAVSYKSWANAELTKKVIESFGIKEKDKLTNAGALLADNCPIRHSRLFCTRWNGLNKNSGIIDALDSAEYSGSLLSLLDEGMAFVKRNMHVLWKKTARSRVEMPDFCERSVFEALVNALIHRDYLINGSEVHLDIFDDRLEIFSPGGMPDGTVIQERNLNTIPSTRRNPVIADIFARLGLMERQGSGLGKIIHGYESANNFLPGKEPAFFSDRTQFVVVLKNLNKGVSVDIDVDDAAKNTILRLIGKNPRVSQKAVAEKLHVSYRKAQAIMSSLQAKGIISRVGEARSGYWRVN